MQHLLRNVRYVSQIETVKTTSDNYGYRMMTRDLDCKRKYEFEFVAKVGAKVRKQDIPTYPLGDIPGITWDNFFGFGISQDIPKLSKLKRAIPGISQTSGYPWDIPGISHVSGFPMTAKWGNHQQSGTCYACKLHTPINSVILRNFCVIFAYFTRCPCVIANA